MLFNQQLINTVNRMARTRYTLNKKVLGIITEKNYFVKPNVPLINFEPHNETNLLSKYIEDKNFKKISEISNHNSKYTYEKSILNIARLMQHVDGFYTTNFID